MNVKFISIILLTIGLWGCSNVGDTQEDTPATTEETRFETLDVPDGFEFKMVKQISIEQRLETDAGVVLAGVKIDIMTNEPDNGGALIASAVTDDDGYYTLTISVPLSTERVYVRYNYVGLADGAWLVISGSGTTLETSSVSPVLRHVVKFIAAVYDVLVPSASAYMAPLNGSYNYLSTYNAAGVPDNLIDPSDIIDSGFLADINASLPENQPVPLYHPSYIAQGAETNAVLLEEGDVWVTFVHEGAGYKNVLGFYTYDKDNPPQSVNDISQFTIIFPNTSYHNSGGGLYSGNKVHIGHFPAGTAIGYFLIANGWNSTTQTNTDGNGIYYSNPELNPESTEEKRHHNVMLWDSVREKILLGFEDINRDNSGCDNDFNDAVFYLTVSPPEAVDNSNLQPIDTPGDADGDKISDVFDDFPNDPSRAFMNYYPAQDEYGTLAFEDLWPNMGDYDFNDLVVEYNIMYVTDTQARVRDIHPTFNIVAVGANFKNGFGFSLPVSAQTVSSVTGSEIHDTIVSLSANGTESGQTKAVFIVCDNVYKIIEKPAGFMVNTEPGAPYVTPVTISMDIEFTGPVASSLIGPPPYNPFLIVNRDRSHEIHLINKAPTQLADNSLFGTGADASNPGSGKYYLTSKRLPWAMDLPYQWDYMNETVSIVKGYLHFAQWAESGGTQYTDWYMDLPQYRNATNIWQP